MKHSVIKFTVAFLFLTQNLHNCNSEPVTLITIGLISSFVTIGTFLWDQAVKTLGELNMEKRLLSPSESLRNNYTRDMKSNLRARFTEPSERVKAEENYIEVDRLISRIEHFHKDMMKYNKSIVSHSHIGSYEKMKSEAKNNLSNDLNRPMGLVRSIYELLVAKDEYSIFRSLQHRFQEGYPDTCTNKTDIKSAQKYILDYLMLIAAAESKAFMTMRISSEIIKNLTQETSSSDVQVMNEELNEKYSTIMETYAELLKEASREVWRCDPPYHQEDVTYTKLNNVFKIFITNEEHLGYNRGCSRECDTLNPRIWNPCLDSELGVYCPGELWDCGSGFDMDIFTNVKMCYALPNTTRLFDNVQVRSFSPTSQHYNKFYGSENSCKSGKKVTTSLKHRYSGFSMSKCDVCSCTSDNNKEYNKTDPQRTERFFYNKPVLADISNDYVMTGARLVKKNGIILIEIQQGKLTNSNSIESSSVSWRTTEERSLYDPSNLIKIHWNQRSIELQDIDVPHGHVLVGLQFDVIKGRIVLKVLSLPINFSDGKAYFQRKYSDTDITVSTCSDLSTTGLTLKECYLPNPTVQSNNVVTNKYLSFSTSSMFQDVGQTTVPLIDIQPVACTVPTLLSGAGIYLKFNTPGERKCGYIGLKLKTYDMSQQYNRSSGHQLLK